MQRITTVLLQEGNWEEILKAAKVLKPKEEDFLLCLEYNQNKQIKSLGITRKEMSLDMIEELKPFFQVKLEPIVVSVFHF